MTSRTPSAAKVYLVYDERMLLHRPVDWQAPDKYPESFTECTPGYIFENPRRIECIYKRLMELQERLKQQVFLPLACEPAAREDIQLAHTEQEYYDNLTESEDWSEDDCLAAGIVDRDIYYCPHSFQAARLACGGVLRCVDAVIADASSNRCRALALVRPPGHHACQSQSMGFCFLNSVAVAAKYALQNERLSPGKNRVVIVDFDIHHGNGTQDLTYNDPNIFYISLHRYTGPRKNGGGFFPYTGHCKEVSGQDDDDSSGGTNLNVAWTAKAMGNTEYAAALCELILPLIVSYDPGLVLVSCGLDAAKGDLIGDCELTAPFYHAMTRSLLTAIGSDTPVVVALEGGYTMHVIAECMEAVSLALLNRDCHHGDHELIDDTAAELTSSENTRLEAAQETLKEYWQRDNCEECYKTLRSSAVRNINVSIAAMQACSRWQDVALQKLVVSSSSSSSRKKKTLSSRQTTTPTHRYGTRSNSNSGKKERKDELDDALQQLQSLTIGS